MKKKPKGKKPRRWWLLLGSDGVVYSITRDRKILRGWDETPTKNWEQSIVQVQEILPKKKGKKMRIALLGLILASTANPFGSHLQGPPVNERIYLEAKAYDYAKRIPRKTRSRIVSVILSQCARADRFDALRVGLVESGLNPGALSPTGDIGVWQLSLRHHPEAASATLEAQARLACRLIARAKREGNLARYHSRTPKFRRLYEEKLRRIK